MTATDLRARVAEVHVSDLQAQLERDPISAARAAERDAIPLAYWVRAQCEWRGLDPQPYLEQIGVAA